MTQKEEQIQIVLVEPLSRELRELKNILSTDSECKLPFNLPDLVIWPQGGTSSTERSLLLMRAGVRYLKERYTTTNYESHTLSKHQDNSNQLSPCTGALKEVKSDHIINVAKGPQNSKSTTKSKETYKDNSLIGSANSRAIKESPDFDISHFQ